MLARRHPNPVQVVEYHAGDDHPALLPAGARTTDFFGYPAVAGTAGPHVRTRNGPLLIQDGYWIETDPEDARFARPISPEMFRQIYVA